MAIIGVQSPHSTVARVGSSLHHKMGGRTVLNKQFPVDPVGVRCRLSGNKTLAGGS